MPSLRERMMSEYGLDSREAKELISGYMTHHHKDDQADKSWDTIKSRMDQVTTSLVRNVPVIDARTDIGHEIFICGKESQKEMINNLCSKDAETADSFRINNYYLNVMNWSRGLVHAAGHKLEKEWDTLDHYREWNKKFHMPPNPARISELFGLETKVVGMIASEGTKKDFQNYMTEKTPYYDYSGKKMTITGWRTTKLPNHLTNEIFASLQKAAKEGTYEFFSRDETMKGYWQVLHCKDLSQEEKRMITSAMTQEIGKGYAIHRADAAINMFRMIKGLECPEEQKTVLKELAVKNIGENWPVRGQEGFWDSVRCMESYCMINAIKDSPERMEALLSKPWQERESYTESVRKEEGNKFQQVTIKIAEEIRDGFDKLIDGKKADKESMLAVVDDVLEKHSHDVESVYDYKFYPEYCHDEIWVGFWSGAFDNENGGSKFVGNSVRADGMSEIIAAANVYGEHFLYGLNEKERSIRDISEKNEFVKEAFLGRDENAVQMLAKTIRCNNERLKNEHLPEIMAAAIIESMKESARNNVYDYEDIQNMTNERITSVCNDLMREIEDHYRRRDIEEGLLTDHDWEGICSTGMNLRSTWTGSLEFCEDIETVSCIYRRINNTNLTPEERTQLKDLVSKTIREADSDERRHIGYNILSYTCKLENYAFPDAYEHFKSYLENGKDDIKSSFYAMNIHPQVILDSALEKYTKQFPNLPQPEEAVCKEKMYYDSPLKVFSVSFEGNGGAADFNLKNGQVKTYFYDTRDRYQNLVCAEAMRLSFMSAMSEHRYTKDEQIKDTYVHAADLVRKVKEQNGPKIKDAFVRFNPEGHMELMMIPKNDDRAAVCVDMETGEMWNEKDGEILSAFENAIEYRDADQLNRTAYHIITDGQSRDDSGIIVDEIGLGDIELEQEEDIDIAD